MKRNADKDLHVDDLIIECDGSQWSLVNGGGTVFTTNTPRKDLGILMVGFMPGFARRCCATCKHLKKGKKRTCDLKGHNCFEDENFVSYSGWEWNGRWR